MKPTKIVITLGTLAALACSNYNNPSQSHTNKTQELEVRAMVCSGYPETVIVKDNLPIYRVVDASSEGDRSALVCAPYVRAPVIAELDIQTGEVYVNPQGCRLARPGETLRWNKDDIRPEEVSRENGTPYINLKNGERRICLTPSDSPSTKDEILDPIAI